MDQIHQIFCWHSVLDKKVEGNERTEICIQNFYGILIESRWIFRL